MTPSEFDPTDLLLAIESKFRVDETTCLEQIFPHATLGSVERSRAIARATRWVAGIRRLHKPLSSVTDILARFGLSSDEGIALMCLAEALLRIPDKTTADALIRDKLGDTEWQAALGRDQPWTMNVAGWALAITGKIVALEDPEAHNPAATIGKMVARLGQPVIRESIKAAMNWMADQFVTGENITSALQRIKPSAESGVRYSFDMLGEGARTEDDAERFYKDYMTAIEAIGAFQKQHQFRRASGVSIKLSALHPRYETAQQDRVMEEMLPKLVRLCEQAAKHEIPVTIDAEEADRLYLALDLFKNLLAKAQLGSWDGLGFAVQAYEKRAPVVIDYFIALARHHRRKLMIRLVKGAYWDTEIKRGQERGLDHFSVYTRKPATDASYLACAKKMLNASDWIKPVFGTHNAMTVAHILELTRDPKQLEFQRLHGMGTELHQLMQQEGIACCVYAPVGNHEVLLGYLVRRLLENGANSSFVHRLYDTHVPVEDLTKDAVEELQQFDQLPHPYIRRAPNLFAPERQNSTGLDLSNPFVTTPLQNEFEEYAAKSYSCVPLINGEKFGPADHVAPIQNPATSAVVGHVLTATAQHVEEAFEAAKTGYRTWSRLPAEDRAASLDKLAYLLEENRSELMYLLVHEAGKTLPDALGEVREAVDFCRYYALQAREVFQPRILPGPTGERNELQTIGRGVFVCISPWNFPLAIFLGQVIAALVAGNSVIAKPAPQTPLIAMRTAELFFEAGIHPEAFHLLPGGIEVGSALVNHPAVAGVAFTGSTATARAINRALAAKDGPIVPLIAETGGQNALIVDSSALPEQVVDDIITSAFRSAGQRCSALRVLCLPESTADIILRMLKGALMELRIGNPALLSTDVGPVIDEIAQKLLLDHVVRLEQEAKLIARLELSGSCSEGTFIAPQAWEIPDIGWIKGEVFGPILHVVRYQPDALDQLIEQINTTGYGLTGGVHSRIEETIKHIEERLEVGNFYVNRSLIGAVVGVQPFGGNGNSGTGPKAGGPHYLPRFAMERVTSNNLTAAGGNASLLLLAGSQ